LYEDSDNIPPEPKDEPGKVSDFSSYQADAYTTALAESRNLPYMALGLAGEAGEVANKVKKIIRDNEGQLTEQVKQDLKKELGDVLWYIAGACTVAGLDLQDVADANLAKLFDRKDRDALRGSGDNR